MADNTTLIIGIVALVLITAGLTYLIAKSGEVAPIIINGTNQTGEKPTITVRGEASKTVTPDLLTIGLSVEGNGTTVSESQEEAAARMARVKSALLAEGVKESDIQTNSFYTQPVYNTTCDYPYGKPMPVEPDGGIGSSTGSAGGATAPSEAIAPDYYPYPYPYCDYSQVIGYRTIHSITVKTGQINEGGELIDAATSDDDARFDYVYFSLKEETRIALESELQGMAAASAKVKAEKIAQGVGARLGRLVSINPDQYYYPWPVYGGRDAAVPEGGASPPTEIFPSQTTMSSSMVVVYELEQ